MPYFRQVKKKKEKKKKNKTKTKNKNKNPSIELLMYIMQISFNVACIFKIFKKKLYGQWCKLWDVGKSFQVLIKKQSWSYPDFRNLRQCFPKVVFLKSKELMDYMIWTLHKISPEHKKSSTSKKKTYIIKHSSISLNWLKKIDFLTFSAKDPSTTKILPRITYVVFFYCMLFVCIVLFKFADLL